MTGPVPLSPELLLEHRSFLRALARSLLADEHEADDVVQEAFARAIERPPDERGALRGWLATVVRNASLNRLRTSARRDAREASVARPEAVPSSAEIVERLAVQRRVVEALAALHEPLRTPVYLRFHEGLPPRAIAERLGRPVETVRSQIQRGLAALRAELDDEYGDRRAWGLALLPLAREAGVPVGPAAVAATGAATGASAWIAPLAWVGALAVLGVASFALLARGAPPRHERRTEVARVALPAADVASRPIGPRTPGAREALGAVAPSHDAVAAAPVAGRVVRAFGVRAGEPVAGLRVVLADGARAEELVTDAAGVFASAGAFAPGVVLELRDGVERVAVDVARRERLLDGSLELAVDVGPTFAFDLVLPPGAPGPDALVARLRDPAAPGEAVSARLREGPLPWVRFAHAPRASLMTTGGRSTWALELASDDGRWGTVARVHAGLEPDGPLALTLAAREPRAEDALADAATARTGTLAVTLASASGAHEPAGALVLVADGDSPSPSRRVVALDGAVRDASGRLALAVDDLPAGTWLVKPPMRDGFAWEPSSARVRVDEGCTAAVRFTCRDDVATTPVAFRVRDADGRPLERFRAVVLTDRYRLGVREAAAFEPDLAPREAVSGEPCARVPDGFPVAWAVEAEGHRSAQGRRRDLVLEDGVLVADVRLERAWRLHLRVATREGGRERALAGAVLSTVGGKELGRTLGDGELALELLYDPGRLVLALDGWRVERWEGFAFGERRAELDLHRVWLVRD